MDDQTKPAFSVATLAAQAPGLHEPITNAIIQPIHMSATFLRDADNRYPAGYVYGRTDNVSVQQAENLIAALEGAEEAFLFGSGMAAATSVFLALEKPTHIVASQVMYWGFVLAARDRPLRAPRQLCRNLRSRRGARRRACRARPDLFWIETPSNPLWTITDIAAIAEIAHARRRHHVRRLDGRDADLDQAAGVRRRHRDAFGDQIPQRPFRRRRRRLATARDGPLWSRIRKMRGQLGNALERLRRVAADARHAHARYPGAQPGANGAPLLAARLVGHPALSDVLYPGLASSRARRPRCGR